MVARIFLALPKLLDHIFGDLAEHAQVRDPRGPAHADRQPTRWGRPLRPGPGRRPSPRGGGDGPGPRQALLPLRPRGQRRQGGASPGRRPQGEQRVRAHHALVAPGSSNVKLKYVLT